MASPKPWVTSRQSAKTPRSRRIYHDRRRPIPRRSHRQRKYVGATRLDAAIDDGLLNIPFTVRSFECVFFDRLGNVLPRPSAGASFTEAQRDLIRQLSRGKRFYISNIHAVGPDGIERTLNGSLEVIINKTYSPQCSSKRISLVSFSSSVSP